MVALISALAPPPAALETVSDLLPYLALMGAGFLVAAWGQAAKLPLAVAIGIAIIVVAVLLFQFEASGFSGSNSPF
ncbi:MAG: hypothetical protein ABI726_08405 [bacterium]